MGTFGPVTVRVPRARLEAPDGKTAEWKNATFRPTSGAPNKPTR